MQIFSEINFSDQDLCLYNKIIKLNRFFYFMLYPSFNNLFLIHTLNSRSSKKIYDTVFTIFLYFIIRNSHDLWPYTSTTKSLLLQYKLKIIALWCHDKKFGMLSAVRMVLFINIMQIFIYRKGDSTLLIQYKWRRQNTKCFSN